MLKTLFCLAFLSSCFLLQAKIIDGTSIGAIFDQTSRPGKEAKVAIEIAIQDFNIKTNQTSVLYLQNSRNKPGQAAIAAKHLIDEHKVKAILGGHTWEEASAIAEVISDCNHDFPVFLSLAGTAPPQVPHQWPFFVQAVPTESTQMKAVAAVLQSLGMRKVTLIYETLPLASSSASIISHLSQAFRQTGSELIHILPLASGSSFLDEELDVLKRQQRKVFVIHTSMELGIRLFQTAKKMEMTGDGYLWIATNGITDLFHSINSTMITSLKGMVGVKSYFPENTPEFQDFRKKFRHKFRSDYPEEEKDEPGIFAVQGYNAVELLEKTHLRTSVTGGQFRRLQWRLLTSSERVITLCTGPKDQGFQRRLKRISMAQLLTLILSIMLDKLYGRVNHGMLTVVAGILQKVQRIGYGLVFLVDLYLTNS